MGKTLKKFLSLRNQKRKGLKRDEFGVNVLFRKGNQELVYYPKGASSSLSTRKTTGRRSYIPAAIEFGHGNAAPIPFLRKAWFARQRQALDVVLKTMRDGVEREGRKR